MKTSIPLAAACAIAMTTAAVAAPPPSVTYSADHTLVYAHRTSGSYTPSLAHKSSLKLIYQNFATAYPKGPYNVFTGAQISGFATPHGQFWIANGFTLSAKAAIEEVDIPAGYIQGDHNIVQVHIFADDNGVPGQSLWAHKIALTENFGTCCNVNVISLKAPVRLAANTPYWLGLTTVTGAQDVVGAWNINVADQLTQVPLAGNTGSGWQSSLQAPAIAFGLYGK
jgi:hypothetical protein